MIRPTERRSERLIRLYARLALGSAFLSAVAGRFGGWGAGHGNFAQFLQYTAEVNAFMPSWSIPWIAGVATVAESVLGVLLVLGVWLHRVAVASAILLFVFACAMAISLGIKSPLDYSVFSASAAALLLARSSSPHSAQERS